MHRQDIVGMQQGIQSRILELLKSLKSFRCWDCKQLSYNKHVYTFFKENTLYENEAQMAKIYRKSKGSISKVQFFVCQKSIIHCAY